MSRKFRCTFPRSYHSKSKSNNPRTFRSGRKCTLPPHGIFHSGNTHNTGNTCRTQNTFPKPFFRMIRKRRIRNKSRNARNSRKSFERVYRMRGSLCRSNPRIFYTRHTPRKCVSRKCGRILPQWAR